MNMNDFERRLHEHADTVIENMYPLNTDPSAGERNDVKMPKKRIGLIAAAVIVAVAGITAVAATFNWDAELLEFLRLTPEQAEKLDDSAAYPMASVTENGVTITVRQTLTDNHGIYVVYDVTAPEDFVFTDDTRFGNMVFNPDDGITSGESSTQWSNRTLSQSGNRRTVLLSYSTDADFKSGRATMIFKDLGYRDDNVKPQNDYKVITADEGVGTSVSYSLEDAEPAETGDYIEPVETGDYRDPVDRGYFKNGFVKQIEGRWELSWDFEYTDTARVIEPELKYHGDTGKEFLVKKIELSPMSVWVETEHSMTVEAVPVPSGRKDENGKVYTMEMSIPPVEPVIKMKDGSTVKFSTDDTFSLGNAYLDGRPGGLERQRWHFEDGIIELNQVESITFGESTLYLDED